MDELTLKKERLQYIIAVVVMLFFVLNDLIFDFLFNFDGSDYIAFVCTLISAIIVFYYNFKMKRDKVEDKFEDTAKFIKSNFDNWQVLFSILDILCGIISILSGMAFLACFFKAVKIGYVPVKILVVANKEKSIIKGLSKFSLLWTAGRLLTKTENGKDNKKEEKNNMFKKIFNGIKNFGLLIWSNKKSICGTIAAIASGVITTISANQDLIVELPELIVFTYNITPYIAGLVIFALAELGVTGKGFESIKTFALRVANAKAQKEAQEKVKAEAKAIEQAKKEAEEAAKKQAEEDKKALELLAQKEAEEKAAQEKLAEEERLLARARELKAQEEASKAQENNVNETKTEEVTQVVAKKQE